MAAVGGRPSGGFPDFGAIFMCNKSTKDECFDSGIFGLPLSFANFVMNVKAGMLLFLFEYERRNLYGVFEATSDGGMNIIPDAYRSSGKSFPAQVGFSVVWRCHPLSENIFRDAIRDNYYSANKFLFGLSKEQVQRLVWLFHSRRVKVEKSPMVKNVKTESVKSPNIELQAADECKNTSNDSLLLGDYIPLSDPEHCDPSDSSDGSDQRDSEQSHNVKGLYCDTPQERPSVFSRLQFGEENSRAELELNSDEQGEEKPVLALMKKLELIHEKWAREDKNTRQKKTNVFSRISFLPEVPMAVNKASYPVEATENAKKRSRQVCILGHGDGKNNSVSIQVEPTSNLLDINQMFKTPYLEDQHKKMKL